jgi:hypothetical protein
MTSNKFVIAPASSTKLDLFLDRLAAQSPTTGRPIFALDATASREPTWDQAATLTASMFAAVTALDVQLIYYRGIDECKTSPWASDGRVLAGLMSKVRCEAGETQIGKILAHAQRENARQRVQALVFIGDACEENPDTLSTAARRLGQVGLSAFLFQEGDDRHAAKVFKDIAHLTHGAYCRFDQGSAKQLAELLGAVAAYAAGGQQALKDMSTTNAGAIKLLQQLR